jgi:transposase-like protein
MAVFTGAAFGALIRLACPHCHLVQARARKPRSERYACRRCRRRFTREQGERAAERRS